MFWLVIGLIVFAVLIVVVVRLYPNHPPITAEEVLDELDER